MNGSESDAPRDKCGVFGIVAKNVDVARVAFFALYALQHRGQEAAGILTYDGASAHLHRGMGLVSQVFNEENLSTLRGYAAIGHTRYSTTGSSQLRNAQPYVIETLDGPLGIAQNGNLLNAPQLRRDLLERGVGLSSSSDTEVMLHLLAGARAGDWVRRIKILMAQAEGAYTLTILTADGVYGVRDPWGMRPLVVGELAEGGFVLASETCALDTIGARLCCEVGPGEIVKLSATDFEVIPGAPPATPAFCTFEHIYFARPDSQFEGRLVHQTRQALGRQLAREAPADADIVVPVPDSGTPHAIGYAQESGIPYSEGLIKSRYIGRTFIQPSAELRRQGVALKFNPLPQNLVGKRIVLVDDSIVRGTTSGPLVALLRKAGAKEVHVRVSCPPITHPCFMGVDMASPDELIAAHCTVEEICERIGADSLAYISLAGLMAVLAPTDGQADPPAHHGFCNACFTGKYPFDDATVAVQLGRLTPHEVLGA